jgi:pSer/pThr/pTyr-binding forkhead associated (FHA) protein
MAFLYHVDNEGTVLNCWELGDKALLVGRADFATVPVQDSSVSRSHFLVLRESAEFFVVDLESQNGTLLNGEEVSGRRLHHGDVIQAGNSLFLFSCERQPAFAFPFLAAANVPNLAAATAP